MDDKIKSKLDEFKSKEEEYLQMNQKIEERRKNMQEKMVVYSFYQTNYKFILKYAQQQE